MIILISPAFRSSQGLRLLRPGKRSAFSLVEVAFALAIFSFSMLTILGLMASGLSSADDSSRLTALANIQRLLRANLDATSYANVLSTTTPTYFTAAGYPTVQNPASAVDAPYYSVSYTVSAPKNSLVVSPNSGKVVQVAVSYPYPVNAPLSANWHHPSRVARGDGRGPNYDRHHARRF